ncbi:MAG: trypsin-like serine protease [bacterium]|nr:trypsin-like serine protease [bacterium]
MSAHRAVVVLTVALLVMAGIDAAGAGARKAQRLRLQPRIVNGTFTGGFASTGALLAGGNPATAYTSCSGTLIGCRTLLTAAHCVCPGLGASCQGASAPDPTTKLVFFQHLGFVGIESISVHPAYSFPVADIAVVRLAAPVDGIAPTPLATGAPAVGTPGTIVGFGRSGGSFDDYGLKRVGDVITAACAPGISNETSVCWTFTGPGANTCHGDSGGPLFVAEAGDLAVAGVTSGGESTSCLPTDRSYDANVAYYAPWITAAAAGDVGPGACGTLPSAGEPGTTVRAVTDVFGLGTLERTHAFAVTGGVAELRITMNGVDDGVADFDLFVKRDAPPTTTDWDCRADGAGTYGACTATAPVDGRWYARVKRYAGHGPYQLTVTTFGGAPGTCGNGAWESGEACDGADAAACPGRCRSDCTCEPACVPDLAITRLRIGRNLMLRATIASAGGAIAFDPRGVGLALTLDDGGLPVQLSIPPNDPGWSRSRPAAGLFRWRATTAGVGARKLQLTDRTAKKGIWELRLTARDVPGASALDVRGSRAALRVGSVCVGTP